MNTNDNEIKDAKIASNWDIFFDVVCLSLMVLLSRQYDDSLVALLVFTLIPQSLVHTYLCGFENLSLWRKIVSGTIQFATFLFVGFKAQNLILNFVSYSLVMLTVINTVLNSINKHNEFCKKIAITKAILQMSVALYIMYALIYSNIKYKYDISSILENGECFFKSVRGHVNDDDCAYSNNTIVAISNKDIHHFCTVQEFLQLKNQDINWKVDETFCAFYSNDVFNYMNKVINDAEKKTHVSLRQSEVESFLEIKSYNTKRPIYTSTSLVSGYLFDVFIYPDWIENRYDGLKPLVDYLSNKQKYKKGKGLHYLLNQLIYNSHHCTNITSVLAIISLYNYLFFFSKLMTVNLPKLEHYKKIATSKGKKYLPLTLEIEDYKHFQTVLSQVIISSENQPLFVKRIKKEEGVIRNIHTKKCYQLKTKDEKVKEAARELFTSFDDAEGLKMKISKKKLALLERNVDLVDLNLEYTLIQTKVKKRNKFYFNKSKKNKKVDMRTKGEKRAFMSWTIENSVTNSIGLLQGVLSKKVSNKEVIDVKYNYHCRVFKRDLFVNDSDFEYSTEIRKKIVEALRKRKWHEKKAKKLARYKSYNSIVTQLPHEIVSEMRAEFKKWEEKEMDKLLIQHARDPDFFRISCVRHEVQIVEYVKSLRLNLISSLY